MPRASGWPSAGDYADVPPLKGIISGDESATLEIRVKLARLA